MPDQPGPARAPLAAFVALILALAPVLACAPDPPRDGTGGAAAAPKAVPRADARALRDLVPAVHDPSAPGPVALVADEGTKTAARRANERPLPAFTGRSLDGTRLSISSFIGKRLVLFFFNPEIEQARPVALAMADVAKQARKHNFNVVGIGVGSTSSKLRVFAQETGLGFPILDDSDASITADLRLRVPLALLGVDAEGYVTFYQGAFSTEGEDARETIAGEIRELLRINEVEGGGELFARRVAPAFEAETIDGEPFSSASLAGKPWILIFFLHTCPHCHHALEALKGQLEKMSADERPELIGISLQNRPSAVRIALREEGIDFFTVLMDPGQEIMARYGLKGAVPDISLIDAQGRIVYNVAGWRDDRDPALMRMHLAKLAGTKVPMLLSKKGYTGNDACSVCHELEAATWAYTKHSRAFDTLVTHGDERDGECVSCHVVGFEQPGGYSFAKPAEWMENVGCESCHGRGGPHISAENRRTDYTEVCVGCHNTEHSLGFDYATFRPMISHMGIASLSNAERAALFEGAGPKRDVLTADAEFVGSEACRSCHAAEFETWAASPHAKAFHSLEEKGQAGNGDCVRCHSTGYGRPGGQPALAAAGAAAPAGDLTRVGCESCHGPGSAHVAEGAKPFGTILSLGDKCDSCVILQICGSCHDEANDPNFEFEVQEHIDRQRHGTTEAGTSKPLGTSAGRVPDRTVEQHLADAFEWLERAHSRRSRQPARPAAREPESG